MLGITEFISSAVNGGNWVFAPKLARTKPNFLMALFKKKDEAGFFMELY